MRNLLVIWLVSCAVACSNGGDPGGEAGAGGSGPIETAGSGGESGGGGMGSGGTGINVAGGGGMGSGGTGIEVAGGGGMGSGGTGINVAGGGGMGSGGTGIEVAGGGGMGSGGTGIEVAGGGGMGSGGTGIEVAGGGGVAGNGDISHGGHGGSGPLGPAGAGGEGGAASGGHCVITVSGAFSATVDDCLVAVGHENSTNLTTIDITSTPNPLFQAAFFSATLGSAPLMATTYSVANVVNSMAVFHDNEGGRYEQDFHGEDGRIDQGAFTLTITNLGWQVGNSSGNSWISPHGTLSATLPTAPDSGASSPGAAVSVTITF